MKRYSICQYVEAIDPKVTNKGIRMEWGFCAYCGIERHMHDSKAYDKDSDCGDCSVKASAFTLMAGSLCQGLEDFDEIWNLFASRVHSKRFVYITQDCMAYEMSLDEFKRFVYAFCRLERESEKNGGAMKIRCRKESSKMLKWLDNMAA